MHVSFLTWNQSSSFALRASALFLLLITGSCHQGMTPRPDHPSQGWEPKVWQEYLLHGATGDNLPDFSKAGYAMGQRQIPTIQGPVFNVTSAEFGAVPNDGEDDTRAIQKAIDTASKKGGGVVYIPAGRYEIRQQPGQRALRITSSHIVVRGAGNDSKGTELHLCNKGKDGPVRRLGTVPADTAARSDATIALLGNEEAQELSPITADLLRGKRRLKVASTAKLHAGMAVIISMTDPEIDETHPVPQKVDLVRQLTAPYVLQQDQTDTFGQAAKTYTWVNRIERIEDDHTVLLAKEARFNQYLRYAPRLLNFPGISETGIENLAITSSWQGGYQHHKPYVDSKGTVIRTAKEQDYLWNGIWISSALDCWIRNVRFTNLTQGIITSISANLTYSNLTFTGIAGHAGITVAHSNDVLIDQVDYYSRLVHPVTFTLMASGNVFTHSRAHAMGRNPISSTDTALDFHGLFPFENLLDDLKGFYICPGGDLSVLPHAGVRNVFWNIEAPHSMTCFVDAPDEFVRTWAYISTSSKTPQTMYEHFPQAFYIGIHRKKGDHLLKVAGQQQDNITPWYTIEGINRTDITIPSLYQAQYQEAGKEQEYDSKTSPDRKHTL